MSCDIFKKLHNMIQNAASSGKDVGKLVNELALEIDKKLNNDEVIRFDSVELSYSDSNDLKKVFQDKKEGKKEKRDALKIPDFDKVMSGIIDKINVDLPPRPYIRFNPVRSENLSVFETKLGGVPYMPKDFEYPRGISGFYEGRPLRLLAQINFGLLPHIPNFPQKGILQFFCSDDDDECVYGIDFENRTRQNGFRVIYHEGIIEDEVKLMSPEDMPEFEDNGFGFPFKGEFKLEAEYISDCLFTYGDYRFDKLHRKYCGEYYGRELPQFPKPEEANLYYDIIDALYELDEHTNENICMGGYPFFTQDDPRCADGGEAYDVLLFQCSSFWRSGGNTEAEILWGDCGVANFFINPEKLKKCDFSDVMYNWDCC